MYVYVYTVYIDLGMSFCPLTFSSAGSEFHQEFDDHADFQFHQEL